MAREASLLERIAAGDEPAGGRYQASATEDPEALMQAVQRNLNRLLNARHGMSECAPDYGLPALSDLVVGSADYLARVQDAIRTAIEKYEPRLRQVRVTQQTGEGDQRKLAFRVDAILVGRSGQHRVWYSTAIAPTGQFNVAG